MKKIIILLIFNFVWSQEFYPDEREALDELISTNNLIQPYSNIPITLENFWLLQATFLNGVAIPTINLEGNCTTTYCRIVGINFSDYNITSIPESFENLIMLDSLNLSYNSINELPETLYSLNELRVLNLSHNNLVELPLSIGNFNSLEYLNLSNNQIVGYIPDEICNLGDINLYLGNNQICPPYPECIMEDEIEYQEVSNCSEHQIGDVNQDSEINVSDIIMIVQFILDTEPTETEFTLADYNQDGIINVIDIVTIVQIILYPPDIGVMDIDGNLYQTIQVGEQIWIKENLKVTHYNNGDEILFINNSQLWNDYYNGQYTLYNNDQLNIDSHGYLYNWSAVNDERGICPSGFHVPTDNEWGELISFLDADANPNAENHDEFESMIAGGLLKGTGTVENGDGYWYDPNTGAENLIDFTALGSGVIPDENGNLEFLGYYIGYLAFFWTSTEINDNLAWSRELAFINTTVHRHSLTKNYGLSVRCIQD